MAADWYGEGKDRLMKEMSEDLGIHQNVAAFVYAWLVNEGFIDYDIEKDLIWERYEDD